MKTKTFTLWLLTDNKPGHRNQLQGLLDAVTEAASVRGARCQALWIDCAVSRAQQLKLLRNTPDIKPDLILMAGHRTHLPGLLLSLRFGGKRVVLMKPSLPLAWFDLCVLPFHDGQYARRNVIQTRGVLNKIRPRPPRGEGPTGILQGLILLGGPSRHYQWDDQDCLKQIQDLVQAKAHMQWTLGSSRRTPASFIEALKAQNDGNLEVVLAGDTEPTWLPEQLAKAEECWVSEDSVSMVYECLSTGSDVGLLSVPLKQDNKISQGVQALVKEQRLTTLEAFLKSGQMVARKAPLQEAKAVAAAVLALLDSSMI